MDAKFYVDFNYDIKNDIIFFYACDMDHIRQKWENLAENGDFLDFLVIFCVI